MTTFGSERARQAARHPLGLLEPSEGRTKFAPQPQGGSATPTVPSAMPEPRSNATAGHAVRVGVSLNARSGGTHVTRRL
jgi:hypothetical protein